jgi:predicted small lipoprotein YifL
MKNQQPNLPTLKTVLLTAVFGLVLSACGNKGDLYLPEEPESTSEQQDSQP